MAIEVYPRLGELLQARQLTVAELERQIELRFALPVDRKTLYRLTYHEPVKRVELDVAAAAATVLGVGLAELFDVQAGVASDDLGELSPEESSRMAELLDQQARRKLAEAERAELDGLVGEYGRRVVERATRLRAERRAVSVDQMRREAERAITEAEALLHELAADPARYRKLVAAARPPGRARRMGAASR